MIKKNRIIKDDFMLKVGIEAISENLNKEESRRVFSVRGTIAYTACIGRLGTVYLH